ncbi:ROK family protein [Histomonas meleagridis]|uniref:ROK family protein n=1 Tax=Histomonas meleagridis TaxID=135588 RepID=UPI00355A3FCA|nr:ROK family protein [Histomonas meleagridis]KAH0799337.1 ROK family protein [Histomonas meleagridis]
MEFQSIGIASFGPIDVQKGCISNTPKPNWRNFPIVSELQKYFPGIPIYFETDVNAPAYSEYLALHEIDSSVQAVSYLTIGTGVGLGVYSDGKTYHGIMHPEFGHIKLQKKEGDTYKGLCPFHGDCLEGIISSNALAQRLGIDHSQLPTISNDNPVWDTLAFYIGEAASIAALCYSLDHFVVGGGIVTGDGREFIIEKANEYCKQILNGYIVAPVICLPKHLKDAGLVGAAAIALNQ